MKSPSGNSRSHVGPSPGAAKEYARPSKSNLLSVLLGAAVGFHVVGFHARSGPLPLPVPPLSPDTRSVHVERDQPAGHAKVQYCIRAAAKEIGTMKSPNKVLAALDVLARSLDANPRGGDVVEAGVAEGGGSMPLMYYLACTGEVRGRTFHLFDTWEGLPESSSAMDKGFGKGMYRKTLAQFEKNVVRWGEYYNKTAPEGSVAWEEAVGHFSKNIGLFGDTMPGALKNASLAAVYCDGDMYSSTMDCLRAAEPRLMKGGWLYQDDYFSFIGSYKAVQEYRANSTEDSPMHVVAQGGEYKPVIERSDYCTIPKDNTGRNTGNCHGHRSEAAFWQKTHS